VNDDDDRLVDMLAALRTERMERTADQKLRAQLENAWTERETHTGLPWGIRRPVIAVATAALVFGFAATTVSAAGDSPLYSLRVTLEDLAIPLHRDAEDRAEYLVSLLEQRTSEAARLEATGNALAAGRAREIEKQTLLMVQQNLPVAPNVVEPAPTESPSPSPTVSPTPAPTESPTPSPVPTATERPATPRPTVAPTVTPKPVVTPTPKPTTTATPQAVTVTGGIKNPDGTYATNVCISLTGTSCLDVTGPTFRVTFSGKIGQSVTLYFLRSDGTKTYKAYITKTVSGTYMDIGIVMLKVQ
jgi:outer membrane biosynthesis protein TonB